MWCRPWIAISGAAWLAACGAPRVPEPGLTVEWTGSHGGRFATPATAHWCPRDSVLEIVAARGDTAVGLAVWAADTVPAAIVHPVFAPELNDTRRPQAAAAVRWFGGTLIYGFEAVSGSVALTRAGRDTVSGTLTVRLRQTGGQDTLLVSGTFTRLPVAPAAELCGRAGKPAPRAVSPPVVDSSPGAQPAGVPRVGAG
jgi:hypothetical protein